MSDQSVRLPAAGQTKVCARCGAAFECGVGTDACWCATLPRVMPTPSGDAGCWCATCLAAAIVEVGEAIAKRVPSPDKPGEG